jgi:lycopene cyclase domain-containing protein
VTYSWAALVGVVAAVALDLLVLRTKLLWRKAFWTSYAIILCFQLAVNGVLTGRHIVSYSSSTILGWRFVFAPVEDLLFGFSLVLQTLAWWMWWGRRLSHARTNAGPATIARRPVPTETRRSRTR